MLPGEMRPMQTSVPLGTGRLRARWAQTVTSHVLGAARQAQGARPGDRG